MKSLSERKVVRPEAHGPRRYTYRIWWDEESQEFAGLCEEFPSLSHFDNNPTSALCGIIRLVGDVLLEMQKANEEAPLRRQFVYFHPVVVLDLPTKIPTWRICTARGGPEMVGSLSFHSLVDGKRRQARVDFKTLRMIEGSEAENGWVYGWAFTNEDLPEGLLLDLRKRLYGS